MDGMVNIRSQQTGTPVRTNSPSSWGETLLGLTPFIILGLAGIEFQAPINESLITIHQYLAGILFLGGILPILAGLLAGWLIGFPRWVYPYILYSLVFSLYLSNASTPGLTLFTVRMWGGELWGWRAWVPLIVVILLGLSFSRPRWEKLARLAQNIAEDWSLLAFSLYSLLPFSALIMLDEMNHASSFPLALAAELVLIIGALMYMRLPNKLGRVVGLVVSAVIAMMVTGIGTQLYWKTHFVNFSTGEEFLLPGPVPLGPILVQGSIPAIAILLILLSPGLIGLVRSLKKRPDRENHGDEPA
jgi:hypothetical protein